MPFQPKSSSKLQSTSAPVASPTQQAQAPAEQQKQVNLLDAFANLAAQLSALFTESLKGVPDAELCPNLVPVLRQVYSDLGLDYDPATDCTFSFFVSEKGGKYLNSFSIFRTAGGVALGVGSHLVDLDSGSSIFSEEWRFFPGGEQEPPLLIFKPDSYALPVSLAVLPEERGTPELRSKLFRVTKFGDFQPVLTTRNSYRSFKDLVNGEPIFFAGWAIETSKKGKEFAVVVTEAGDKFFFPENKDFLEGVEFPIVVQRVEENLIQISDESGATQQLKIGGGKFKKLSELAPGGYLVHGYEMGRGEFEGKAFDTCTLTLANGEQVSGNSTIVNWAKLPVNRLVSSSSPALLWVKGHQQMKNGNNRVNVSIQTVQDLQIPMMRRLLQIPDNANVEQTLEIAQEFYKAAKTEAIPF